MTYGRSNTNIINEPLSLLCITSKIKEKSNNELKTMIIIKFTRRLIREIYNGLIDFKTVRDWTIEK
jgi:hypothetical protein